MFCGKKKSDIRTQRGICIVAILKGYASLEDDLKKSGTTRL